MQADRVESPLCQGSCRLGQSGAGWVSSPPVQWSALWLTPASAIGWTIGESMISA
jgi:hypothetical protein